MAELTTLDIQEPEAAQNDCCQANSAANQPNEDEEGGEVPGVGGRFHKAKCPPGEGATDERGQTNAKT